MQSADPERMGEANSIFDYFTSVLLWILAMVTCCLGARPGIVWWRRSFWFLAMFGLGVLAIDEVMEIHEYQSRRHGVNDDFFKVFLWVCSGIAVVLVAKMEKCTGSVRKTLIWGYVFQTAYILVEVIDEFGFKFSREFWDFRRYTEEELEFMFLSAFLVSFSMMAFPNWKPNAAEPKED
jgi:hypothetical protein